VLPSCMFSKAVMQASSGGIPLRGVDDWAHKVLLGPAKAWTLMSGILAPATCLRPRVRPMPTTTNGKNGIVRGIHTV
jgi:hypothetical protein